MLEQKLPGGFVGVDIFYVISGFLITKIILVALHQGSFSYLDFYSRRVKRLLPAAFFMVLATLVFGYWILTPDKYVELAKSAVYASVFLANFWFAKRSGYFDQSAEISPLVHMWSLAVEEQYYLFFPLLLVMSYKRWKSHGVWIVLFGVFSISFLLSLLLSEKHLTFLSIYFLQELGSCALEACLSSFHCRNSEV